MKVIKVLSLLLLSLVAMGVQAQGVSVYSKDGSRVDYLDTQIDSLVFFEKTPVQLDVPETVESVDLGLSVKWANCNMGAQQPQEIGAHFAWGELETKDIYDWSTYFDPDCKEISGSISGTGYDVVSKVWGGNWRIPTLADMQELCDKCTWTWSELEGQTGCLVTGPSGASIFLPAAGTKQGQSLYLSGSYGSYLSGQIDSTNDFYERSLVFFSNAQHWMETNLRDYGQSIRPVCN